MYIRIDTPNRFKKGEVIKPSWSHYIKSLSTVAQQFEEHLESIRVSVAPHKASRLQSVFAFDINAAENFLAGNMHAKIVQSVYELTVNPGILVTEHNYNVISHLMQLSQANDFALLKKEHELMVKYWTGNEMSIYQTVDKVKLDYNKEYLIQGNATVTDVR